MLSEALFDSVDCVVETTTGQKPCRLEAVLLSIDNL